MRLLMDVVFPEEPFNTLIRKGTAGPTMQKILEAVKPQAAYFTNQDGHRGGILVVEVKDSHEIPALCEPFYLTFNAKCSFRIAMVPEDLGKAGLDKLGKMW